MLFGWCGFAKRHRSSSLQKLNVKRCRFLDKALGQDNNNASLVEACILR